MKKIIAATMAVLGLAFAAVTVADTPTEAHGSWYYGIVGGYETYRDQAGSDPTRWTAHQDRLICNTWNRKLVFQVRGGTLDTDGGPYGTPYFYAHNTVFYPGSWTYQYTTTYSC